MRTHGFSPKKGRTPEYHTWCSIKARCLNPHHSSFPQYGGRGITVCDRWAHSFEAFLEDMGRRPVGCTIDRIDHRGNYEPENCRWATAKEQARNRTSTTMIEANGETRSLADWAERLGVPYARLRGRIDRGMDGPAAIFLPKMKPRRGKKIGGLYATSESC